MPSIPDPKNQWYVVQVISGSENKVAGNIKRRVESEEMSDYIFKVLVPEENISEVKFGKKIKTKKKIFPGYVIINMHLFNIDKTFINEVWSFIQETDGVIGFVGSRDRPSPMPKKEVDAMLSQVDDNKGASKPVVQYVVGDSVVVSDGPFQGQDGYVAEVNLDKGELMVSVNIFGRETLVALEYWQVENS